MAHGYVILSTLGVGPSGTAYLALDPVNETRVVYKEFSKAFSSDAEFLAQYRREVAVMATLDHPNCTRALDFFMDGKTAVVVTEYVVGVSLRATLAQGGRMTPAQALGTARGILQGLAHAGSRGLIHGDLRPENIQVTPAGVPRLTSFAQGKPLLARPRDVPGRVAAYVSPERLQGFEADQRADVYSAAAVIFTMLTGRQPFAGETMAEVLKAHVREDLPDPRADSPEIPGMVALLVQQAMSSDPDYRPQSAQAFLESLDAVAAMALGSGWINQGSIAERGAIAANSIADAFTLDTEVQASESVTLWDQVDQRRRRLVRVVAAAAGALTLLGAGAVLGPILLASTRPAARTSVLTEVTPTASPSPSPDTSPSPSPSPTPTAAPPGPPPAGSRVSLSGPQVFFAPCFDNGSSCDQPADGAGHGPGSPFNAAGYRYLRLLDVFNWSASTPVNEPITVTWTTVNTDDLGSESTDTEQQVLTGTGGTQSPDPSTSLLLRVTSSGHHQSRYSVTYSDGQGQHQLASGVFAFNP